MSRAILQHGARLEWAEVDVDEPGPGEVRIRVVASALNRADLAQRAGLYPPPPGASPILGLECAGFVEVAGDGVADWAPGDPVCALLVGGGFAERVVCPAAQLLAPPPGISLVEAATLPEVWATAWSNLVDLAGIAAGRQVLIHAGASGVGLAALQLSRLRGVRAFALAGTPLRQEVCRQFGAEATADRRGNWADSVRAWAPGGVSAILDPVGGSAFESNLSLLATDGTLVLIGLLGGPSSSIDLARLLVKRLTVRGSALRSRTPAEKGRILQGLSLEVWPAFADGRVIPTVDAALPITEVERGMAMLASNQVVGKIALVMPDAA